MLYEQPQHAKNNSHENDRCIIVPARLHGGRVGVGIKHSFYMMFLPPDTALDYATRIADVLNEIKDN